MATSNPTDARSPQLPEYTVRVSTRAKYSRLRVTPERGLEVIVPSRFDRNQIPVLLKEKEQWIERVTREVERQRKSIEEDGPDGLPQRLAIRALDTEWRVEYVRTKGSRVVALEDGWRRLVLRGGIDDHEACKAALRRWVFKAANEFLIPWLLDVSEELDLPCGKIVIRSQRTRLGSCSPRDTISLNAKLMFIPEPLVHYVFVHELCHTIHLDHSSRFWEAVAARVPDYRKLDTELRRAWWFVPSWMYLRSP